MATHLSTHLVWHDRAWDGHDCAPPSTNAYRLERSEMLPVPSCKEGWDRKQRWYECIGFVDPVITSDDGADEGIGAAEIERITRARILEQ